MVNTSTGFSPFQLVHGMELILSIECKIPSIKLEIELLPNTSNIEEFIMHLEHLDEKHKDASMAIEVNKLFFKVQYDKSIYPWKYTKGELVILYDPAKEPLGAGNFNPMWHDPYIVQHVLDKGSYKLKYYEGNMLDEPRNGLYLKSYYT
jgi:hypothetical protein